MSNWSLPAQRDCLVVGIKVLISYVTGVLSAGFETVFRAFASLLSHSIFTLRY